MPHIVVKLIKGPSSQQLQQAAEQICDIINQTLGKPKKYTSVSVEAYTLEEWEGVYEACIKDHDLVISPGYTNPKTFE